MYQVGDWYCFECHGPGYVVPCPTCFRVYHPDCIPVARESQWSMRLPIEDPTLRGNSDTSEPEQSCPPETPCPVCQRLARVRVQTDFWHALRKIFLVALDGVRNKGFWKTLQKVGYLEDVKRNDYLAYLQVNTRILSDRMKTTNQSIGYPNRTTLLVDLDNLVHNTVVFYGTKSQMSGLARQARSQLKRSLRESTFCIDCYLRPQCIPSVNRLTMACHEPHRLLWFHHNGWSFRPCKILYESPEGYEVVCFGGRHERDFVLRSRMVDMSFTSEALGLRHTPSLKKTLDEVERYKLNQADYDKKRPAINPLFLPSEPPTSNGASRKSHSPRSISTQASGKQCRKRKLSTKRGPSSGGGRVTTDASSSTTTENRTSMSDLSITLKRRKSSSENRHVKGSSFRAVFAGDDDSPSSSSSLNSDTSDEDFEPLTKPKTAASDACWDITKGGGADANKGQRLSVHPATSRSEPPPSNTSVEAPVNAAPRRTQPVIRIKPLPERPPSWEVASKIKQPRKVLSSKVKPSSICSLSGSSSANSSGSTTIPAIASADDRFLSSDSSDSDTSQSSHKVSKRSSYITNHVPLIAKVRSAQPRKTSLSDSDSESSLSSTLTYSRMSSPSTSEVSTSTVSTDTTGPPSPTPVNNLRQKEITKGCKAILVSRPAPVTQEAPKKRPSAVANISNNATHCESVGSRKKKKQRVAPTGISPRPRECCTLKTDTNTAGKLVKNPSPPTRVNGTANGFSATLKTTASKIGGDWTTGVGNAKFSTTLDGLTPRTQTTGPTPPSLSSSSYSSVSPAAMSTTSGLGSSLSDPKSIDASPSEIAALYGGGAVGGHHHHPSSHVAAANGTASAANAANTGASSTPLDPMIIKSIEEVVYRQFSSQLSTLTTERDQSREDCKRLRADLDSERKRLRAAHLAEVKKMRSLHEEELKQLRSDHEEALKKAKRLAWCFVCQQEAMYHCCAGVAYCSPQCQLCHWNEQHYLHCSRRAEAEKQQQQPT